MSAFYDEMLQTAKDLLSEFGEESKIVRVLPGAPTSGKSWDLGAPTTSVKTVSAAWIKESLLHDDALVKQDEAVVIVAASDLAQAPDPSLDHVLRMGGQRFNLVSSEPLDPAGVTLIYELRVRR